MGVNGPTRSTRKCLENMRNKVRDGETRRDVEVRGERGEGLVESHVALL